MINKNITDIDLFSDPFNHIQITNFFEFQFISTIHQSVLEIPNTRFETHDLLHQYSVFLNKEFFKFIYSEYFLIFLSNKFNKKLKRSAVYKYPQVYKFDKNFKGLFIHNDSNQNRDVAVLFYLSKNWCKDYGGELNLYSKIADQFILKKTIQPLFNTCIAFEISKNSWHALNQIRGDWIRYVLITDFDYC